MNYTDRRIRLRSLLAGSQCHSPASVYDPLSARIAQSVGFEIGLLSGSVVSSTTLAAPDLAIHTITEFADQVRRITRVSTLSVIADADTGYGNALNVMRTVQELEHAGVSCLCIEDTIGPMPFGEKKGDTKLVPVAEMVGKLKAALAARSDPALVIAARTEALKFEGYEQLLNRVKAYAATGVDVIWLVTLEKLQQLEAAYAVARLPIIVGSNHGALRREDLAAHGARIMLQGHLPPAAAVKALRDTYVHLFNGGAPADWKSRVASEAEMDQLLSADGYHQWLQQFMR